MVAAGSPWVGVAGCKVAGGRAPENAGIPIAWKRASYGGWLPSALGRKAHACSFRARTHVVTEPALPLGAPPAPSRRRRFSGAEGQRRAPSPRRAARALETGATLKFESRACSRKKGMPWASSRGAISLSPLSMNTNWRAPAPKNSGTWRVHVLWDRVQHLGFRDWSGLSVRVGVQGCLAAASAPWQGPWMVRSVLVNGQRPLTDTEARRRQPLRLPRGGGRAQRVPYCTGGVPSRERGCRPANENTKKCEKRTTTVRRDAPG